MTYAACSSLAIKCKLDLFCAAVVRGLRKCDRSKADRAGSSGGVINILAGTLVVLW
jgi:hypothetical protein